MHMRINLITSLLVAAPAAIVIATAPSAWGAPSEHSCFDAGGATHCQTPGNAQIYTSPHASGFPLQGFSPHRPSEVPSGGVQPEVAGRWGITR